MVEVIYLALQLANKQTIQDLSRLVTVTDILERIGCILAGYIKEHFLSAANSVLACFFMVDGVP